MRTYSRVGAWGFCWLAVLALNAHGAEFFLQPTGANGTHTIVGTDEIRLMGTPQRVFIDIRLKNWGPSTLKYYQVVMASTSYSSGTAGTITPASLPCVGEPDPDGYCATNFGSESYCNDPAGAGVKCEAGFIDKFRSDYAFFNRGVTAGVDISSPNYRYFTVLQSGAPVADPAGASRYGGSLVLDVPGGATGTFTIEINGDPGLTYMGNPQNQDITPLIVTPMRIVIQCQTQAHCNDNNACTNDVCNVNGTCSNMNNYNAATQCCNPATGTLLPLSDGNACTDDVCNTATGQVTHPPSPALTTSCGSSANSQCDHPDSCDGAGNCNPRLEPNGADCGSDVDTECDGRDTCNGAGVCVNNLRDNTTPCGSQTSGPCDDPDRCNGLGTCLENNKPNGVPCSTGQFCIEDERCQNAVCTDGTPTNCADLLTCTTDSCDEAGNQCLHPLQPGNCLIDGVCYSAGEVRPPIGALPGNTCEHCDPSTSTTSWTVKPDGSACNDGNACTGTSNPGIDPDTCTSGICAGEPDPQCNDTCDSAVTALAGVPNLSNNASAGPDDGEASCEPNSNNDVWFKFTANCDGVTFASTTGSVLAPSNDTVLSVYTACPPGGAEIACDDDSGVGLASALNFSTTGGSTYLIRVAGFDNNTGPIVLNIRPVDDCQIDGVCYSEGDLNPQNDCQACVPEISSTEWSPRPEGSPCGNLLASDCDNPDACDGAGVCENNYKPDDTLCSDETVPCAKDLCPVCTKNLCRSGVCTHPPEDAGLTCGSQADDDCDNPNTCNGGGGCANNIESAGHACGDQSDTQCDNPNICDGFRSQAGGGCLSNPEIDGVPCDDQDICTGNDLCAGGNCVGTAAVETPIVEGISGVYLRVTPQDSFVPAPVALRVTSPNWPCMNEYVNAAGKLVVPGLKVHQLPSDWGSIVVYGEKIVPSSVYHVEAECGSYRSAPGIDNTWKWGDLDNDDDVDATDVLYMVYAYQGFYNIPGRATFEAANIANCPAPYQPNNIIDATDVVAVVDAFKQVPYWCSLPCP